MTENNPSIIPLAADSFTDGNLVELQRLVNDLLKSGIKDIQFDMKEILLLQSLALGRIIMIYKQVLAEGGTFRLFNLHEELYHHLLMCKFDNLMKVEKIADKV